ncbi:hypothetical protein AVEN_79826-1 [Araneus ventricosus]|uniref:Uncharacterized protein n=1 Tax=Araneus ventricosus TaxID=182803 RepID=A0A4Y2EYM0_ARAVE|nr:hypothetical protein AVEN_79826-1 [Araneus ventricosus]
MFIEMLVQEVVKLLTILVKFYHEKKNPLVVPYSAVGCYFEVVVGTGIIWGFPSNLQFLPIAKVVMTAVDAHDLGDQHLLVSCLQAQLPQTDFPWPDFANNLIKTYRFCVKIAYQISSL